MVEDSTRGRGDVPKDKNPSETSDASVSGVFLWGLFENKHRHSLALVLLALASVFLLVLPVPSQKLVVFHRGEMALVADPSAPGFSLVTTHADLFSGKAAVSVRYGANHSGNELELFSSKDRSATPEKVAVRSLPATPTGTESSVAFSLMLSDAQATGMNLRAVYGGVGDFSLVRMALLNTANAPNFGGAWAVVIALLLLGALLLARPIAPPSKTITNNSGVFPVGASIFFVIVPACLVASHALVFAYFDLPISLASEVALHAGLLGLACALASWLLGVGPWGAVRTISWALVFGLPFVALGFSSAVRDQVSLDIGTSTRLGLWIALVFIALESLLPRVLKGRERRNIAFLCLLEALTLACPLVATVYRLVFGQIFAAPALEAIWQTNPHEALRFASAFLPHICVFFAVLIFGSWGLFKANTVRVRRLLLVPSLEGVSLACASIVFLSSTLGIGAEALRAPVIEELRETWTYFREVAHRVPPQNFTAHRQQEERISAISTGRGPETHLVVLGESANRDHHSLYGYARQTSPWLDQMAASGKLMAFQNAYAGNKYTFHALEMALTEADQYDRQKFSESVTLVEALKSAGYTVTWLSNQERDFNRGMPFGVLAESCDVKVWTRHPGESFDEELVGLLERHVDPSRENIVFIHMNGSHLIYGDRVPANQKVFSTPESAPSSVEAYDDSIRYTDRVLEQLFNVASSRLNLASFIYFSDHGEVPGVPRDTFLWPMARIPFVVWLSEDYREGHSSRAQALWARRDAWWTNDLFFDLALGLYDVASDRWEMSKDLSSEGWAMERHELTTENGRHYLATDPLGGRL